MSQHSTAAEALEPTKPQDPERLPMKKVIAVALVALLIFGLSVLWADDILGLQTRRLLPSGPAPAPGEVGKPQVGMVNQLLFELQTEAANKREQQLKRLESYGWVDRDKQIIRIPISRAMEQMAAEASR
jgi:hypothetical protein